MPARRLALAALGLLLALPALAEERILVLRTAEDPRFPPDLAVCDAAPFAPANVLLGAGVWSVEPRRHDGEPKDKPPRFLGTATGCGRLGTFAPFVPQPFLIHFNLVEDGEYTALGTCAITSNAVPEPGVLLVTCGLDVTDAPAAVAGGSATSASLFNLFKLPGYDTGSIWTLRLHDPR